MGDEKVENFRLLYADPHPLPKEVAPDQAFANSIAGDMVYRKGMLGGLNIAPWPLPRISTPRLLIHVPKCKGEHPGWTEAKLWEVLRAHTLSYDEGFARGSRFIENAVRAILGDAHPDSRSPEVSHARTGTGTYLISGDARRSWEIFGDWTDAELEVLRLRVLPRANAAGFEAGAQALSDKLRAFLSNEGKHGD